jgi:N-acetylglucosamine-6-phosphate deacetylase
VPAAPAQGGLLSACTSGPYIDAAKKGRSRRSTFGCRSLDYRDFFSLGNIRLISLAPELDENKELIGFARGRGASVAVGHSSASYEQVEEAVRLGLNQATHTFNQMEGLHHRKPGAVGAALLLDEVYAQLIADGIHLHPAVVDMVVRLKGPEKAVLITDAIRGAGMPNGEYELGDRRSWCRMAPSALLTAPSRELLDPRCRRPQRPRVQRLRAGRALQMATLPGDRSAPTGGLGPGEDADVVLLDQARVVTTIVRVSCVLPVMCCYTGYKVCSDSGAWGREARQGG